MSNKYKVCSVIVCEDVRQEVSGKEILIGVYNDSIILSTFPGLLPQLVIRVVVKILDQMATKFTLSIKDPHQNILKTWAGTFAHGLDYKSPVVLGFRVLAISFIGQGNYSVHLGIDDEPVELIHEFQVRQPIDEN